MISGAINVVLNLKVTWLLIITILIKNRKWHIFQNIKTGLRRYYYLCLLLSLGIIIVCGTNLDRVAFYTDFIAMLLLVDILAERLGERWQRRLIAVCCIVTLVYYIPAFQARYENYGSFQYIEHQMKEEGREVVAVRYPVENNQPLMDFFRRRFVNPAVEFGYYSCYMAFNPHDINIRYAASLYHKPQMVFLPEDVLQRMESDSTAYRHYESDAHQSLYIWQLPEDTPVNKVVFELKPEDLSALWPHQRLVAYKDDIYELDDHFHYSVINVNGRTYLVFTRPTTNITRRIRDIKYL